MELALEASNQKEKDDNEVRVNLLAEEKQKQMVLANELEAKLNERLNTWRSTIQIGEICLVGPLNTGFNQKVYLKALVIDKRNPLIQVQYDGSTNDPKTNVSLSSRVEWVQIKSLFPADTKFQ